MLSFRAAYKLRSIANLVWAVTSTPLSLGEERAFKLQSQKPELRVGGKQGGPLVGVGEGVALDDAGGHRRGATAISATVPDPEWATRN